MVIKAIESGTGIEHAFPSPVAKETAGAAPAESFSKYLGEMVGKVNDMQLSADKSIQSLATGEATGLHEVMLAVEKASISFQFLNQVRNKAVEAYQEIMRMPV
ncbi:flagellar hook-basal body complex protein FliE [Geotalea daltonii FRC-32]|uniref:Flagellar hook-basal body complex protein FliE n=1 Tax=Geotalea daltonii (strain DSM 22248 / JCM 15807 / FRC-32) TaxID=316067 RepID=B9LZP8_GEODF|nr:flagellar hook-basal body complex protein FliE [Geotalea daltonii]ACM18862.1 flagellar hook-basal body complex protein FliE [Geotalea daltonii FRC-32]